MTLPALTCPSCAAKQIVRRTGRFECAFCGTRIVPRLEPGTLCGDGGASAFCAQPAVSLCRRCSLPLCDWHDAPRRHYWHADLSWRTLCPGWSTQDGVDWGRLNVPFQRFPVGNFEPFEWVPHVRRAQYALGQEEDAIVAELEPIARDGGGSVDDQACAFEYLCSECETELTASMRAVVARHASTYRRLAVLDRLEALAAEAEQGLRYVEAFLGRPLAARLPDGADEAALPELGTDSLRLDWDRWGHSLRQRLETVRRLRDRAAQAPEKARPS